MLVSLGKYKCQLKREDSLIWFWSLQVWLICRLDVSEALRMPLNKFLSLGMCPGNANEFEQ